MRLVRIQQSGAKTFYRSSAEYRNGAPAGSIVDVDLVEKRVAQAVGVRVPVTRPFVGRQRRRPQRVRAVAAVHRQVETVAEEKLRPFPPGAELLHAPKQVVLID